MRFIPSTPLLLTFALGCAASACGSSSASNGATPDSGSINEDSGNVPTDGAAPLDSTIGTDTGAPGTDSGVAADSAVAPDTGGVPDSAGVPETGGGGNALKTVFMILMENHNWSTSNSSSPLIKGSASAPYINSLLAVGAHAENYFDNPSAVHPSEPNYIWLEAGDNLGITTDDDPGTNHQSTTQHLVTLLAAKGVSWRAYVEGITAGSCPISSTGLFAPKHTPMLFFDDVVGNPPSKTSATCIANVVPYTKLAADLSADSVARYNFITPNLCDDMHNATGCQTTDEIKNGDTWLSTEVPKIMASSAYTDHGVIFIVWDESEGGELPIGMIVLSPKAKVGYSNTTKYYHSSTLRTVQEIFGVTPLLRDAANQPDLSDLFTSFP